ncbi:MAG: hypothetical protein CM15mP12_7170 [Gammaproteobacteria bacterium]|nr:MAG: hypothetical protein CM15mP12_7170 [Gammaproteobacteria bacterium]
MNKKRGIIFLADRPYDAGRAPTDGAMHHFSQCLYICIQLRLNEDWLAPNGVTYKKGKFYFSRCLVRVNPKFVNKEKLISGVTHPLRE